MAVMSLSSPKQFRRVSTSHVAIFALLAALCSVWCSVPSWAQDATVTIRPLITQAVDESQRTVLKGNTHPLARAQYDLGAAPASLPMERMLLVLKRSPEQEYALRTLLDNQQDKHSPNYHQWLTPDEYGKQFGPSDADMQIITGWLQAHGFQLAAPSKGRTVIEFSGSASQVQEAFHTTIHKYLVNGEQHWANDRDPSIPTALTPAVAGVSTLNNFPHKPMNVFHGIGSRDKATGRVTLKSKPEFTFPAPPGVQCNHEDSNCYTVAPLDFATIYNVLPVWNGTPAIDGTGQRIAIVQETNINPADPQAFRSLFGLPATPNSPNIILNGPDPGIGPAEGEADLDVEWSGAVAKGATIDLVVSAQTDTTPGVDLSAQYIVDNNLDGIMSESFGGCEQLIGSENQFYFNTWEQAAAQGISVFLSSGDQGSAVCDLGNAPNQPDTVGLAVSGFASTPFNVAVGGTDFQDAFNPETYWNTTNLTNTQESAKGYIPEYTWDGTCTNTVLLSQDGFSNNAETNCNNSNLANFLAPVGGGGGASVLYSKPSWQTAPGVPADGVRDVPDVSLFASNGFSGNSYVFCESDISASGTCDLTDPNTDLGLAGGTSFAAPAMAGVMALIDQKMGGRQGNPNYVLYKLAAQIPAANCNSTTGPASDCIFNDVTAGTIRMPCVTGSTANCTTNTAGDAVGILNGYDTGVGYDLATGIGTVNVNNLVTAWPTATFTATTTTLTLNGNTTPITVAHGTNVSVGVTVAPTSGSGTPTGDVALIAATGPSSISNQTGVGFFTLSSGKIPPASTTNVLPGGTTYNVTAHYEGDGMFAASDSAPPGVKVTVTAEGSTTTVSGVDFSRNPINGGTFSFGTGLFVRADVASAANASTECQAPSFGGCPTGTVAFTDNGTCNKVTPCPLPGQIFQKVLNPSPLNSQGNTSIGAGVVNFDAGNHSISASYGGDASFTSSQSNPAQPVTFTIQSGFNAFLSSLVVVVTSPGQSGSLTADVFASTGFTTPVAVTCSGLPTGANCSAGSITPNGPNNLVAGTITITTNGTSPAAASRKAMLETNRRTFYMAAILGGLPLVGIFFLSGPARRRNSTILGLVLLLALVVVVPSCGGGSSHNTPPPPTPTPAGNYNFTLTLTAGTESLQSPPLTLIVQ